nr:energy transducer TonB [Pseudomonas syringae]
MISTRQKLTRYGGSLLLVLAVHAIAIIVAVRWPAPQPVELPPAAMMVELAPVPEPAPPPPPKVVQPPPPPAPEEPTPVPEVVQAPKPEIVVPKKVEKPKPVKKVEPVKKPTPPAPKPSAAPSPPAPPTPAPAPPAPAAPPAPVKESAAVSGLASLGNPPPEYPGLALRRSWEGRVILRIKVLPNGRAGAVEVTKSSGKPVLDEAAVEAVRNWKFIPAKRGDTPIEGFATQTIDFKLPE